MQVDLQGPAGRLEALYEEPGQPRFAAMVCHPHPLFGGTLHNHATFRLARAVRARVGVSLRFNFRGVGRSQGVHGQGRGEADDARAALAWLARRRPELPRLACGFSFGAFVALEVGCRDPGVRGLLAAGLAPRSFALDVLRQCPKPVAAVQAAQDEFGSPDEVRALLAGAAFPRRLAVVEGATHLFTEDLDGLQREAEGGLSWLMEPT
jgi:alpha/beta superfamily hydrolase